jgi:hypothetical protein
MFASEYDMDVPLLALDVYTWLLVRFATGLIELPTANEMRRRNEEEALDMMKLPYFRVEMDENYSKAVDAIPNFWPQDSTENPEVWDEEAYEGTVHVYKLLARVMREGDYPISYGTYEELNEHAETSLWFGELSWYHRNKLQDIGTKEEKQWRTFRDCWDAHKFYSFYTGTEAVPLKEHWLDL